jgi:hypothetical protein
MDEKGGGGKKPIHQYAGRLYNSKPPQQMDEKEVASLSYCQGKWMKNKRGAMKKEELVMVVSTTKQNKWGKRGKGQSFVRRRRRRRSIRRRSRRRRRRIIMWQMKLQSVKSSKKMHCWQVRNRWGG